MRHLRVWRRDGLAKCRRGYGAPANAWHTGSVLLTTPNTAAASHPRYSPPVDLTRFAWLSIGAAVLTIAVKSGAALLTGSVGLLSDAAESLVNLVAAIVALIALHVAIQPPDRNHPYGHSKAEYFSAAVEGIMIFAAAAVIIYTAVERLIHPQPLERLGLGLALSVGASVINGLVALVLLRQGRRHDSMTLVADGKHLMTDVITSVAVLVGVALVAITDVWQLAPIVALLAGANILFTGVRLVRDSVNGLMDAALPDEEVARLRRIMDGFAGDDVAFHAVRTRMAGARHFASFHVLVPGDWTVKRGHDAVEDIIDAIIAEMPNLRVEAHLEPREDPRSYEDLDI